MSVLASSWVWRYAQVGGTALIVLLAIADHADDDGYAFPSVATLARKARLDGRTVQRIIRRLVETGALQIVDATTGGRRSNTYRLVMTISTGFSTPVADCHPGDLPPVAQLSHPSPGADAAAGVTELRQTNVIEQSSNRRGGAALPPPTGADRCSTHIGQYAANCGPCRSLVLAGGVA